MRVIFILLLSVLMLHTVHAQQKPAGTVTGPFVLGEIRELDSRLLSEKRKLNIYLPEGYHEKDTILYPVVYLLDGSADEDFIHIAGLYQYISFPWINYAPQSIIVGITNTDRKRDFTFPTTIAADKYNFPGTGKSAVFIDFIEKELQPFIAAQYRVSDSKTIIGQSLGGLLATEILLKRPRLFNQYIIISPSLWWDNGSLLSLASEITGAGFNQPSAVYIGVGKEGATPGEHTRNMEDDAKFLAQELQKLSNKYVTVYFDYLPDEDHATIGHLAVYHALKLLSRQALRQH